MIESLLQSAGNILLAVLGISFLIFIHELGHFVAARLFAVRVEVFSIGFGPRLFGRRSGPTDYRVSAIPLGGYVKMAGEYGDYDEALPPTGDDLMSKPIWQRLVVFLAGPAMNLALAFVLFPAAFGGGVPFVAPVVGDVEPGGPAWNAGLEPGDEIQAVNGSRVYGLSDVILEVALGDPEQTRVLVKRGEQVFETTARSQRKDGRWDLGISQPVEVGVRPDGPAASAGLLPDDRIVAVNGRRLDTRVLGRLVTPAEALSEAATEGEPLVLAIVRQGTESLLKVVPEQVAGAEDAPRLGALPLHTRVAGLRDRARSADFPLQEGDVLLALDGQPVTGPAEVAAALERAAGASVSVRLQRGEREQEVLLGPPHLAALLGNQVALGADESGTCRIRPVPGGPLEEAGLLAGDTIVSINARPVRNFEELRQYVIQDPQRVDFVLRFSRDGSEQVVNVRARPTPQFDYGLFFAPLQKVHDLSLLASIGAGLDASLNALRTTGLTLSKLFTGEVSADNLGGPIQIGWITYRAASLDLAQLLFFLALLSVNLGIINLLPIPVLDGGQIVFLLCEKVKGSRLSERFLQNAQLVGFVAIVLLMVFVTVNDILKLSD